MNEILQVIVGLLIVFLVFEFFVLIGFLFPQRRCQKFIVPAKSLKYFECPNCGQEIYFSSSIVKARRRA